MKLIINGKYIEISEYVELIEENPIINNFDTQFSAYSNTFEIPYSGEIMDVLDISAFRKTTSPYILIDCHVVDGVLLIPAKLIVMSFDVQKNTIKVAISEKIEGGKGDNDFDIRTTKLTELRHASSYYPYPLTDEHLLQGSTLDTGYLALFSSLADNQTYPHAATPLNTCPLISISRFHSFLYARFGIGSNGSLPTGNFFANGQKYKTGDILDFRLQEDLMTTGSTYYFYPKEIRYFPAGFDSENNQLSYIPNGEYKTFKLNRKSIDAYGNTFTLVVNIEAPAGETPNINELDIYFNNKKLSKMSTQTPNQFYFYVSQTENISRNLNNTQKAVEFKVVRLISSQRILHISSTYFRLYTEMPDNNEIATSFNSRQLFQNLPDITVLEFLKQIAKASARYIEISGKTIIYKNISDSLLSSSIVDATDYFIKLSKVDFSLYDSENLEYWYKEAEQPTLVVPISDETVKKPATKIDIDILLTNDNNVQLFKEDGITPRDGIATYPFLDITNKASDLRNFYLSIQKPQIITATFQNFEVKKNQSILVRQLNGVFIPTKIIRTNKNIIELELLKIEE